MCAGVRIRRPGAGAGRRDRHRKVHAACELLNYTHEYPERFVTLHVFVVENYSGRPTGVEGQALQWERVDVADGCRLVAGRSADYRGIAVVRKLVSTPISIP